MKSDLIQVGWEVTDQHIATIPIAKLHELICEDDAGEPELGDQELLANLPGEVLGALDRYLAKLESAETYRGSRYRGITGAASCE